MLAYLQATKMLCYLLESSLLTRQVYLYITLGIDFYEWCEAWPFLPFQLPNFVG